ncbi:unnamed protein product [Arctia plantaginis]|uniref:C2H2-type domain-containing protein n=1 Tax=Arctia plantaginis TaxID=874455 RepID=A0A8S1B4N6_ARCPL|nr:unnamed protein product [Arctia plantaginis]
MKFEEEKKEEFLNKNIKKTEKKYKPEDGLRHNSVYKRNYLKTRLKMFEMYIKKDTNKNEVLYSCKNCEGTYKTKRDILKHIREQHYTRCKCEQCGKPFKYERQLESHVKSVHGKTYVCQHCNRKYDNKYRLTAHEKTHTNQEMYQCDICQKVLRYKTTIRKHILHHNGENKMLCDFCGKSFAQKSNLESHIKSVHLKMRPFSCPICNKTYTAKKHVKNHMKIAHSGNPKPHQCDLCTKSFACPKSFKIHRLTHENHFSCRYCSLVFNNKNDIEIHTKSHTKEHLLTSPFSCHVCGKILLSKFTLNRHLEIHSGIKRFACNVCGLKFTQKSLVKRHYLRKHDPSVKIEKVKCDLCKKLVRDLEKHMEIHDADKRKCFCDMCGKNYPTNNALNRHKKHKHYGVSYDCDVCGKQYIKKGSLKTHKLKVHKIKKEIFESVASVQNIELTNVVT